MNPRYAQWREAYVKANGHEPCMDDAWQAGREHGRGDTTFSSPSIPESDLTALLPGPYYMDPPDGGSVTVLEQLRRMSEDARKWRRAQGPDWRVVPEKLAPSMLENVYEYVGGNCYECTKELASWDDLERIWKALLENAPKPE